ncbi:SDR family NAD(P)-dependent oxidoreductase [Elioraea sp.]|uniref:SDR family NAD(P)-dependent oxidoreductase n=1 Tax=Elioraea sp. TaxID=2185103 RepID=UPI0025B97BFB|nr:SDR family NAD(P)-dependent oxidoreductase [Elioraea sp.]
MNIRFDGKSVAVTGAGHGIGRVIARAFAERGAHVFACDVNETALQVTARTHGIEAALLDVTARAEVRAWVAAIEKASGGALDVVVNNAGGVCGQPGRPIEQISDEDWDAIVRVNLTAAFAVTQAAAPAMKARRRGRVVNISSGAGLGVSKTGIQAYASAKAGQIGLTRQLAHELGPFGITVNSIAPGFVLSNPATMRQWDAYGEAGQRALVAGVASRRLGTPEDMAHAVLFLASDYAGYINGQTISVDGGK